MTRNYNSETDLTRLLGGIDQDIRGIFLSLNENKLRRVFTKYGQIYGVSKLIYAKNTYESWKSGSIKMSGLVLARLLNLVPTTLDPDVRFELVKKLRKAHLKREHLHVECDPSDWFKKVPQMVDELIESSRRFEMPLEVLEKLTWLAEGDAQAANDLLVAAEVDEARVRTQFLTQEYSRIGRMLNSRDISVFTHTIEIPQGSVLVKVTQQKLNLMQRMPLSPTNENRKRRLLTVICKNLRCRAELDSRTSVYDGEPIHSDPEQITCTLCGAVYSYTEDDLNRYRQNLNVEVRSNFFGRRVVGYDCPNCSTRLTSPLNETGQKEVCPKCDSLFVVPSP